MRRVIGFEFLISPVEGDPVWVRLQGSGGCIGDGALAMLRDKLRGIAVQRVIEENLKRARHEANETGAVRVWRDHEDPAQRIRSVKVIAISDCRAIWERT